MPRAEYPRWWPHRKVDELIQNSTIQAAEDALKQAEQEKRIVFRMRPRVERVAHAAAVELETNHLAELFRPALRGGTQ